MLQNKDTQNINELKSSFVDSHKTPEFFTKILDLLQIGKYHRIFSKVNTKGISILQLVQILLTFPFLCENSVHSFTNGYWNSFAGFGKDAYYRLKNNCKINWRSFLFAIAKSTLSVICARHKDNEEYRLGIRAFIFDDTPIEKTGRYIEGVSRIWNHVINRHILGYQLLVMGLYDGTLFLPVNFSLHREKGKNPQKPHGLKSKELKRQFLKKRDSKTAGAIRKKELDNSKIKAVVEMLKSAVKTGISADYVLTDSWFTCWETVKTTLDNGMHYVGMFSKVHTKFNYNNKELTYKEIRHVNRKKVKRNRRFNLYYIRTVIDWNGQNVVLYASRKGKHGKWRYIISTDLSLDFTKTVEIYQIRWSIEVFFKDSKQQLGLGKSQSQDFDAQIADITLSLVQYSFLVLQNSIDKYETLGNLFAKVQGKALELRLHQRLIALLISIIEVIATLFEEADYMSIFEKVIYNRHALDKICLLVDMSKEDL